MHSKRPFGLLLINDGVSQLNLMVSTSFICLYYNKSPVNLKAVSGFSPNIKKHPLGC